MKVYFRKEKTTGRVLPEQWIFGGICRETKDSFLIKVPDRKTGTLLLAIQNNIEQGTTIYSDCWSAYNTELLKSSGFVHYTVNHSYKIVVVEITWLMIIGSLGNILVVDITWLCTQGSRDNQN